MCICFLFCVVVPAQASPIKAAVVLGTWKTDRRFSGMEDCMLPSPVILGSGYMVIVLVAVCLDNGRETHRFVWVSEYMCLVDVLEYTPNDVFKACLVF